MHIRYGSSISNQRIENSWVSLQTDIFVLGYRFVATGSLILGNILQMGFLWFVFSALIQCELDRLTKEWNTHEIRKSNHSLASGIPDGLYFFSESLGYEQCEKNAGMAEVNEIANESNVHLDFQGIQTTSEPGLVNYFKYLVQASNELHPPTTWEGA